MKNRYTEIEQELILKHLIMNELCRDMDACIQMVQKSRCLQKIITAYVVQALSLCRLSTDQFNIILQMMDFDLVPVEENPFWGRVD